MFDKSDNMSYILPCCGKVEFSMRQLLLLPRVAMKIHLERTMLVGVFLAITVWHSRSGAIAEEPVADQSIKKLLEQATDWYDVLPNAESKERLSPQIVLRWQNPVRTQTGAGVVAIWTSHGRPEAMASIFRWDDDI